MIEVCGRFSCAMLRVQDGRIRYRFTEDRVVIERGHAPSAVIVAQRFGTFMKVREWAR